tara:strand:- start:8287 stop:9198 length:912 start_codon:yes stop_codon:yes gene_type:complete
MRLTKLLLSVLLVISLFITACGGDDAPVNAGGSAFIGGSEGVVPTFEQFGIEDESTGIYTIFDSETFPIDVTVQNKGEYEIQPGDVRVTLLGPSQEEFSGIASYTLQNTGVIEKISDLVKDGGVETISFASDAKYESPVTGALVRNWLANLEYNYQTYLIIPEVCLKEDIKDERVCDIVESKSYDVSGAPLTVTSVEEKTSGKAIMALTIEIKKEGTGKFALLGEEFGVRDKVGYSIDDPAWECKSGGKLNEARLTDGTAEVTCRLKDPLAKGTLATKKIELTFDYQYQDIIQEKLLMKETAK